MFDRRREAYIAESCPETLTCPNCGDVIRVLTPTRQKAKIDASHWVSYAEAFGRGIIGAYVMKCYRLPVRN